MEHNARMAIATPLKRTLVREENYNTTSTAPLLYPSWQAWLYPDGYSLKMGDRTGYFEPNLACVLA